MFVFFGVCYFMLFFVCDLSIMLLFVFCMFVFSCFCFFCFVVNAAELEELNRKLRKQRWYHQQKVLRSAYVIVLFVLFWCVVFVCLFVCVFCSSCLCVCLFACFFRYCWFVVVCVFLYEFLFLLGGSLFLS